MYPNAKIECLPRVRRYPMRSSIQQHLSDSSTTGFADNVGFREKFIDYYNALKKLEGNTSRVQYKEGQYMMLIGEEGHHYFANTDDKMINKFRGRPFLSEKQLHGLVRGLNNAQNYLDEKGIPLIVMFCADKEEIYPEYYPKPITRGLGPTQLELITEYAKNHTDVDLFNIKECLLSVKGSYPVFDKVADSGILSHYNEIGAFFAYQELMKHIETYLPNMEAFTIKDVDITFANKGIYPNIPDIQLKREVAYQRLESDFFDSVPLSYRGQLAAFENSNPTLPTILFLRDSYAGAWTENTKNTNFLSRYIPEHFSKTIFIHWLNMANFESYIESFKPDIVVFESAERELAGFSDSVSHLQNLE